MDRGMTKSRKSCTINKCNIKVSRDQRLYYKSYACFTFNFPQKTASE